MIKDRNKSGDVSNGYDLENKLKAAGAALILAQKVP